LADKFNRNLFDQKQQEEKKHTECNSNEINGTAFFYDAQHSASSRMVQCSLAHPLGLGPNMDNICENLINTARMQPGMGRHSNNNNNKKV
jgi:hypothetical protein